MAKKFGVKLMRGASADPVLHQLADYRDGQFEIESFQKIESDIAETQKMGRLPLWEGYSELENYHRPVKKGAKRSVKDVRSDRGICQFYSWLVTIKKPQAILEFGSAFGVSGMYWLSGLEQLKSGILYSFEPNETWFPIAKNNFSKVGDRYKIFNETFEERAPTIDIKFDIILIDAIHTSEFVNRQFELVKQLAAPGALVVFDDINFSPDMRDCWAGILSDPDLIAAWELSDRAGMVELPS